LFKGRIGVRGSGLPKDYAENNIPAPRRADPHREKYQSNMQGVLVNITLTLFGG